MSDIAYKVRNRPVYVLLLGLTVAVGLASRRFSHFLPAWMAKNAGDVLYATMAFWLVGLLFPRLPPLRVALAATLFCFGIEFLKFVQTPWFVAARHSRAGALVLGVGFHGSNLVCYASGVALALFVEMAIRRRQA